MKIFEGEKDWTTDVKLKSAAKFSMMNRSIGKSLRGKDMEKRLKQKLDAQSVIDEFKSSQTKSELAVRQKDSQTINLEINTN